MSKHLLLLAATVEDLLRRLAEQEAEEKAANAALDAVLELLPERLRLVVAQQEIAELKGALRDLLSEPGKIETSAGTVSLVAARSVEYPAEAVRLFAPEVAALVIKQIPAREEVDRVALERAVKAGIKAGTLGPDTLAKLETKATIRELSPRFTIKLSEPGQAPAPSAEAAPF